MRSFPQAIIKTSRPWAFRVRHWHVWAGVLTSLPAFLILFSGLVLLLRRELPAIHPPTLQGGRPGVTLPLQGAIALVPELRGIEDLAKAEALPSRGIWKLRTKDLREIQVDAHTGAILHSQVRHTGWWIGIHEGSLFSLWVTYLVFLPSTLAMLWLWGSGLYLFFKFRR